MALSEHLTTQQALAFIEETDTAVQLLDAGIRNIEGWDAHGDRRIVGLHLMAQGFERLLKLTQAMCRLREDGALPTAKDARGWGHRLVELLDSTIDSLESDLLDSEEWGDASAPTEIRRGWRQQDIKFLRSDERWRQLIQVLADFASGGRYHSLDVMLDGQSATAEPMDGWSACEMKLFQGDPRWYELMVNDPPGFSKQWYPYLAGVMVGTLQRAARALVRAWVWGPASDPGKKLTGAIGHFLFLSDDELSKCPARTA